MAILPPPLRLLLRTGLAAGTGPSGLLHQPPVQGSHDLGLLQSADRCGRQVCVMCGAGVAMWSRPIPPPQNSWQCQPAYSLYGTPFGWGGGGLYGTPNHNNRRPPATHPSTVSIACCPLAECHPHPPGSVHTMLWAACVYLTICLWLYRLPLGPGLLLTTQHRWEWWGAGGGAQPNSTAHSTALRTPSAAIQSIPERSEAHMHSAAQRNTHYSSTGRRNARPIELTEANT